MNMSQYHAPYASAEGFQLNNVCPPFFTFHIFVSSQVSQDEWTHKLCSLPTDGAQKSGYFGIDDQSIPS